MKFYKPSKNQSGATLPTLDTPATPAEIEEGKEAINGSGNKITGTLGKYASGSIFTTGQIFESGGSIVVDVLYDKHKKIIEHGNTLSYYHSLKDFGNATAADVAKGKTFTSIAGFNEIGTLEAIDITNFTALQISGREFDFPTNVKIAVIDSPLNDLIVLINKEDGSAFPNNYKALYTNTSGEPGTPTDLPEVPLNDLINFITFNYGDESIRVLNYWSNYRVLYI